MSGGANVREELCVFLTTNRSEYVFSNVYVLYVLET